MLPDLRQWLADVEALGELEVVRGADWKLEIGTLCELWGSGAQALLFDDIPGYPGGHRVLTNALNAPERIALALGMPPITDRIEFIRALREKLRQVAPLPAVQVDDGPVLEVVRRGDDADLLSIPVPLWHELDGGRMIGTGCLTITRDPETGWVNAGAYRVQVHDAHTAGVYVTLGKHGRMAMDKYWAQGKPCPIAVSVGQHPALFIASGVEVPFGVSEYDYAGGLWGEPVRVLPGPATGLPVPADAEIVLEGEIFPDDLRAEGPFGEWTGYYVSGTREKPVIRVSSLCHRRRPILCGAVPGKPPSDNTYFRGLFKSAAIWDEVERAGVPGVTGLWEHPAGGGRMLVVVAIRQLYPGHAKQVGHVAAYVHQGAYANRIVVVVDDDVDPSDTDDVLWAICTRTDLRQGLDIIDRNWTTPNDPTHYGTVPDVFNTRMIVDACRPWERRSSFPAISTASPPLRQAARERWAALFARRREGPGTGA